MRRITILLLLPVLLLLLAGTAQAMFSANYRLDWFTPLTGGGGGPAGSANYGVDLTVGQSVIGASSSANYGLGLGYWYGVAVTHRIYLPLLMRNNL
jgi:hypothetical protein